MINNLQFRLWDVRYGQEVKKINIEVGSSKQLFPYCNNMCLIIHVDEELLCLNILTEEVICRYEAKSKHLEAYAMSKDNKRFLAYGIVYNCERQDLVSIKFRIFIEKYLRE